jgi:hypothetical protein
MARDSTLSVRRAILTRLKADSATTTLVPADRIYPQQPPALPDFPFIRYGSPTAVPIRGACMDGAEVTVALHGFSKGRRSGDTLTVTAEDDAGQIGAAMAAALDGQIVDVDEGRLRLRWTGSQLLPDPDEAGVCHVVVNVRGRVV